MLYTKTNVSKAFLIHEDNYNFSIPKVPLSMKALGAGKERH